jgi:threonyl-tRNA synthetase
MADEIYVTFADGSRRAFPAGAPLIEVARALGLDDSQLLAGRSGDRWLDVREPLFADLSLRFVMASDPEADEVVRHSAEHILAEAVCALWPDARVDAGRSDHAEKFQYDFALSHRLSREDLPRIEARMLAIIAADEPFVREALSREQARALFADNPYKLSRLDDIPTGEAISVFRHGDFIDLCRGPHVQRPRQIGAIALLDVAGSYFRGDERNPMLQRVSGTAFGRAEKLAAWKLQREEAERRDHRVLGKQLDLFSIDDAVGGGLVLWHPKGASVRRQMEDYWRDQHAARGYDFVFTPHIGRAALWQTSGHLEFFKEGMFAAMTVDTDAYHCKPMNCPFHAKIYAQHPRSYRELPLRLAELGTV